MKSLTKSSEAIEMNKKASQIKDYLLTRKADRELKQLALNQVIYGCGYFYGSENDLRKRYGGLGFSKIVSTDADRINFWAIHAEVEYLPLLGTKSKKVVRFSFVAL